MIFKTVNKLTVNLWSCLKSDFLSPSKMKLVLFWQQVICIYASDVTESITVS